MAMSGSGTALDPYLVTNATDLKDIETYGYDKYYKQTANITLGTFTAIGHASGTSGTDFTGEYDGDNKTIENGTITVISGDYYNGIFARCNGATIKNLVIDDVLVTISNYGAILTGYISNSTIIDNITIKNSGTSFVGSSSLYAGCLVGSGSQGTISNITMQTVTATITAGTSFFGIIIGHANVCTISFVEVDDNCLISAGTVDYVGGIAGYSAGNTQIEKCYNGADISADERIGGIVGYQFDGDIYDCHNKGTIEADVYVGGILGEQRTGNVHYCLNEGTIEGLIYVGGIVGLGISDTLIQYNYALNTSIIRRSGTDVRFGRICGANYGQNNYALDTMTFNT